MNTNSSTPKQWRELFTGRNAIFSAVLTGGVCLNAIDAYISVTMLPSIVRDIGRHTFYAWSTTLYVLAVILTVKLPNEALKSLLPQS